jgi:hypothetical protein
VFVSAIPAREKTSDPKRLPRKGMAETQRTRRRRDGPLAISHFPAGPVRLWQISNLQIDLVRLRG